MHDWRNWAMRITVELDRRVADIFMTRVVDALVILILLFILWRCS